ncbi:MAG: cytochrome b [Rudaea sp.]
MALTAAPAYSGAAKTFHWLIAALVVAQFVISWLMPGIGRNTVPGPLIDLHFSLGVLIIVVMALRFVHRLSHRLAPAMPDAPAWERRWAQAIHGLFYAILLVVPFLGWASASAHHLPVRFFGLFTLPDLAPPKARWALRAGDIHTYAMWTLLGIISLHAAAALYHHFVRRDGVLQRMLPAAAR